jgi:hypothetical protein
MRDSHGLTTLELVIVSSLAAVLLGLSVMTIGHALAREELNGWARTLVHEIGAAQQAAVTRRSTVTASFQNQVFTVVLAGGATLRQETLPSHLTFGATLRSITFDRRGTPGGSSSITLNSTTGGRIYTILIEPGTGRVSLQ